ncbi:MAG: VIT domain-containing protein [Caldilineaceae bacterium]
MRRTYFLLSTLLAVVVVSLALLGPNQAALRLRAQGIIIDPPPAPPITPVADPIRIQLQQVDVTIDGPVAQVRLTQMLRNSSPSTVEGSYIFPLPADAAVSDFQMTVDGQVLEGQLLSKEDARRAYEEIVRRRRDPALLEYLGHDLFQVKVFPIPAGATRKLELHYVQLLAQHEGLYQFRYPLQTHQYSHAPVEQLAVNMELVNRPGLRTIYSPNYEIAVARTSDRSAHVSYKATAAQPQDDFVLYFGTDKSAVGLNLLSYKPANEDGFFVLLAAPGVDVAADAIVQRNIIMVLDVSGSMQGEKMEQAKAAARFVVDHLNSQDRFNLVAFSTGVRLWQTTLQSVGSGARKAAHQWLEQLQASGSTDINRALLEALAQLDDKDQSRPTYILFLTDGLPTQGETDTARILGNVRNNRSGAGVLRLFTFGVGYDVNTTLLDALSQQLRGRSSYVRPDERIDEKVSSFYAGVSTPVLSNVALQLGDNVTVDETYPYPLPDLFAGEQLVMVGRYHDGAPVTVTLRGEVNGKPITYRYPNQRLLAVGGEPALARLWAARKISALLSQMQLTGPDPELIDAVVELSLQYGIVTPYTSAFVPEPNVTAVGTEAASRWIGEANDVVDPYATPAAVNRAQLEFKVAAALGASNEVRTGQAAVVASQRLGELATADTVATTEAVRFINGKTFVRRPFAVGQSGERILWVDTQYKPEMKVETIVFGGDCYFTLAQDLQLSAWLALSSNLLIVHNAQSAWRITTDTAVESVAICPAWQE